MVYENVLELIKLKGPVIPIQISKEIGRDIITASAILSELVSSKHLMISAVKVGGSPLYYIKGQEKMIAGFADKLSSKEREAYEILKENKILRDASLEPPVRVALRRIKDFAKPLYVTYKDKKEVYWKWFLVGDSESEFMIKNSLGLFKKEEKKIEEKTSPQPPEREQKQPTPQHATPKTKETEQKPQQKEKEKKPPIAASGDIITFFNKNRIELIETQDIKKKSESDYVVRIPSSVGPLTYYCRFKSKKKVSDSDLASAYVAGQLNNLPVLLLTDGELSKKSRVLLEEEFKSMTVKNILK